MLKSRFRKISAYALGAAALMSVSSQAQALTFMLTFTTGTSAQAQAGFTAAAARWSSIFTDNAVVNLTVGTAALGPGILGQAASVRTDFTYTAFKTALAGDITSASDALAVANLDPGNSFGMLINRTSDNPNGSGSATPYLDLAGANNQTVQLTNANAKALGLAPTLGTTSLCVGNCDAGIQFSSNFAFDYDPSDGISAGQYDFVGIATHEIGHALGFVSGVDVLDGNSPPVNGPFTANQFTFVSSLDLFRYSTLSASQPGGVIDWTADTRAKCISLDGGATLGACFSTGRNFGDGQQASHWKDNLGIGIMDPTAGTGELLSISANDRLAFDVIGWNLAVAAPAVPEPGSWMMMLAGFGLIGGVVRRRRSTQVAAIA
jgi:PEP-CTERM motif